MSKDNDDVFDLSKLEGTLPPDVIKSLGKAFGMGGKDSDELPAVPQIDGEKHPLECCSYHAFLWLADKLEEEGGLEVLTKGEQATAVGVLRKVAKEIREMNEGEGDEEPEVTVVAMGPLPEDLPDNLPSFLQNLIGVIEKAAREAEEGEEGDTVLKRPGVAITRTGCEVRDADGNVVKLGPDETLRVAATVVAWVSTQSGLLQDTLRDYTRKEQEKLRKKDS